MNHTKNTTVIGMAFVIYSYQIACHAVIHVYNTTTNNVVQDQTLPYPFLLQRGEWPQPYFVVVFHINWAEGAGKM